MPGSTPIDFVPGVGKRTAQVLHKMGVHTAGQLAGIPDGVLENIFGPSIQAVMAYARRKNLPQNPAQYKLAVRAHSLVGGSGLHAQTSDHLSWWRKFQLAARVVSVL